MTPAGYYTRLLIYISLQMLLFADQNWDQIGLDPAHFIVKILISGLLVWRTFIDQSGKEVAAAVPTQVIVQNDKENPVLTQDNNKG